MKQKIFVFIFLYLFHVIISSPTISGSLNIEDITVQKCFSSENDLSNQKTNIYQIINNSTSNTIFIQYKSLSNIIISDSIKDESSVIYKDSENLGSYYLNMDKAKNNYYVTINKKDNDFKICFQSFSQNGNDFKLNEKNNTNIKTASYNLITNANLTYYISNCDLKKNKIFNTIRFEQSVLDKINNPKIQIYISFINSKRQNELYTIDKFYLQDKYYYVPFYIPKLNYTEKFTEIIICINIEFKQALLKDEQFKFDLDLIDTQEITNEFNINLIQKDESKNSRIYPKLYFINLMNNIYEFDRDILLLKHDSENKYLKPFLTSNINIHNDNSYFIQKDLIDLNQKSLSSNSNNTKDNNLYLLILILDETINEIKHDQNENIFISFRFYGGYHALMHYKEEISVEKFFNGDKNKILIKMPNCRTQYFINYYKQVSENKNDERILDIESSIGHMNLFYMNQIKGNNLNEYFINLKDKCIHKFENSILSGNFGTMEISCPDNSPVMSYIYAHKKNMKEDFINFMNQKSLLYIEYNTQYSFKFNENEKINDFVFRIKPLRTNIQDEDCKIEITYNNQNFILDKENPMQTFIYSKNSDANTLIKINSNNNIANINTNNNATSNKGIILEIYKGIDIVNESIIYIEDETEKGDLSSNSMISFIYSKKEINSAYNKIQLLNTNTQSTKINLCIRSGKGVHPFISKPVCTEEKEYIILEPGQSLNLTYNNPYLDGKFDEPFYVSLISDNNIKYSYGYERQNKLEQEIYAYLNHNGKKILKLSNQKHDKKSIYYQINVCENKNSNFYYIINNSEKILINNDIYQECSLDDIKSFLVEFEGDGEQKAKFKYYYGSDKLLNKIEKFSKNIILSKSDDDKGLLIIFQTPFVQQIDVKIIFGSGIEQKYKDICSFEKDCKINFDSGKFKLFSKKAIARDNQAIVYLSKKEIKEFLNTDIDIYIIAKSIETNLEIFYNVKSMINLDLNQLDSAQQINDEDKNYICINCGGNDEQNKKEDKNINNNEQEEKEEKKEKEKEEKEEKENNNEENKNDQKNNGIDQPIINPNPINVVNNNENNNNDNENNNNENNENNNNNNNNENKENINTINEKDNNNENNENNNEDKEKNNIVNSINEGNDNNKVINSNNENNNENKPYTRNGEDNDNDNQNRFRGRGNNYGQNNKNDAPKNREDEKDGDIDNDKDNNNGHEHGQDNEQGFDNNQNNENSNINSTNSKETINENDINAQNQLNNGINPLDNNKIKENDIKINNNQTKLNGDNNTQQNILYGEKAAPKKSRKILYIMLIIISLAIICYIRNQWCNNSENVSYSKISKYSYYDF